MLKEIWVNACNKENWTPSARSTLCTKHFQSKYVDVRPGMKPYLRRNAVPTIFGENTSRKVIVTAFDDSFNMEVLTSTENIPGPSNYKAKIR